MRFWHKFGNKCLEEFNENYFRLELYELYTLWPKSFRKIFTTRAELVRIVVQESIQSNQEPVGLKGPAAQKTMQSRSPLPDETSPIFASFLK